MGQMKELLYVAMSFMMALWSIGIYQVGLRFLAERSDVVKVLASALLGSGAVLAPILAIGWVGEGFKMTMGWKVVAMATWLVPFGGFVTIRIWRHYSS